MNFYTNISKNYDYIFPLNKAQVKFVESFTSESSSNLLDIGCGTGNLSIELSKTINNITAIDLDKKMLDVAISKNKKIDFRVLNMLEIDNYFKPNTFDNVCCFGNTMVHLSNIEEIKTLLTKIKLVLKSGGTFLFQVINYNNVLDNNLIGLPTIENENAKFERIYTLDNDKRINFRTILTDKIFNNKIESNIKLFPIRKEELHELLLETGFLDIEFYSSFNKLEYSKNSLPLVGKCE